MRKYLIAAILIVLIFSVQGPTPQEVSAEGGRGVELYTRHCASCHGADGAGRGPAAQYVFPAPRNFASGVFKFRSTPSGEPPTDADLKRTILRGVPGTSMPAWDRLPEADVDLLVGIVKSFSDVFQEEDREPPVEIPAEIPSSDASIARGRAFYNKMKCFECHGPDGRGDGPAVANLRDDKGVPILPFDFTRGSALMKGGSAGRDIYRTFVTGLDGTPMPSYAFLAGMPEDGWALVHFIQSLSKAEAAIEATPALKASRRNEDPSLNLDDAAWQALPATDVPLRPLWARNDFPTRVSVQAISGPEYLSLRLEWQDATVNDQVTGPQSYRDAVAVQTVVNGQAQDFVGLPFIGMGERGQRVALWSWKADWERDLASGYDDAPRVAGHVPDMQRQIYDENAERLYLPGSAAGNPQSQRHRSRSVESMVAEGFGTLTSLPEDQASADGRGASIDGRWVVVMRISKKSLREPWAPGASLPVALAVWDGAAGDRNGQKTVSTWLELSEDGEPGR